MLENNAPLELTIQLPEQLHEQIESLARQRGETVSDIIRIALTHYFEAARKPWVKSGVNLEQGRNLMRELGLGLGASQRARILDFDNQDAETQAKIKQDNHERNQNVAALITQWLNEEDDYDERVWPEIERGLKKHTYAYPDDEKEEK